MADDQDKQFQNQSQKIKHLSILLLKGLLTYLLTYLLILTGTNNDAEKMGSRHLWIVEVGLSTDPGRH